MVRKNKGIEWGKVKIKKGPREPPVITALNENEER